MALQERLSGVRIVVWSLFTYTNPSRNMIEVTSLLRLDRASSFKLDEESALFYVRLMDSEDQHFWDWHDKDEYIR